jgi:Cdc6-like AAA superfamily ATPase
LIETGKKISDGLSSSFANLIPVQQPNPLKPTNSSVTKPSTNIGSTSNAPAFKSMIPSGQPMGSNGSDLWTTKYAPNNIGEILGNTSYIREIMQWLKDWDDVVIRGNKKEVKNKFVPGKKGMSPNYFSSSLDTFSQNNPNARACLVSGPPGIGKTTSVRMIAKIMGYELIEQNASDVRNKNAVTNHLAHLKDNTLVSFKPNSNQTNKVSFVYPLKIEIRYYDGRG